MNKEEAQKAFDAWQEEVKERGGLDAFTDDDKRSLRHVGNLIQLLDGSTERLLEASKKVAKKSSELSETRGLRNEVQRDVEDMRGDLHDFREWWDGQLERVQNLLVLLTSLDMGLEDENETSS